MTRRIASLSEIADSYGAIVLDQWGVLHDGTAPYPGAIETVRALSDRPSRLAMLSNSGKRAAPNGQRIAGMGFDPDNFACVMTSGEALWRDIAEGRARVAALFAITGAEGDAQAWADGLDIALTDDMEEADAVLLMGLPEDAERDAHADDLARAREMGLPIYCSNPDRASPRAGGGHVTSPGALAHAAQQDGATVHFYGKPHAPIFRAVESALNVAPERLLMVGDSLEHDIAGGHGAGWSTAFVTGGLYAAEFADGDRDETLARLARAENAPMPDYVLETLA